jgi:hypothetical protein
VKPFPKACLGYLQEIRWVLKDTAGIELPLPARKTIDLERRLVKPASVRVSRLGKGNS